MFFLLIGDLLLLILPNYCKSRQNGVAFGEIVCCAFKPAIYIAKMARDPASSESGNENRSAKCSYSPQ